MEGNSTHQPVLLFESIHALNIQENGIYIDATFGRGGHSRAILAKLSPKGKLLAIDKDPEAIAVGQILAQQDERFSIIHAPISSLEKIVVGMGWSHKVHGILFDLGVSSPQLDNPGRGFSFLHPGPLDMRMDCENGQSAGEWLAQAEESEISDVLKKYGEERYAQRIARAITNARNTQKLINTQQLAQIISQANPRWEKKKHPATRSFQAIRIFINRELEELYSALEQVKSVLAVRGHLAIISFHSLEDRIVKQFFKKNSQNGNTYLPSYLPITENQQQSPTFQILGKPIVPNLDETTRNPRSRSAKLRVAQKMAHHSP
ncbi:16S rRNA (cytosine(1402)-N(4))-methyltransferase RsmH [Candidatus Nitrosacidococcus tergens]|uniref:Ribosomal RNA small subunit methyltransferase H n=1 Tax=Candidatus Nitrosacidococcus tergens TaxID=553981 RepID=A0A7G1QB16_9GAMM|nr:16S rRNA (cytosine(1402)-N(4))-methyltransferase RsmH [Candidatus Nitrosacidococcus tergens]CAB1276948.1 S-adenosyl-dependent methyltransferase activity on membrane-located substrates [Candidatus Nitrosacidococcus tergens]